MRFLREAGFDFWVGRACWLDWGVRVWGWRFGGAAGVGFGDAIGKWEKMTVMMMEGGQIRASCSLEARGGRLVWMLEH